MPTVGWIQETAIDRYWEQGDLGRQVPSKPRVYHCPYCDRHFAATSDLAIHISVDHPIERPLLIIGNRLACSEQTIRSPITPDQIVLTHVKQILVSHDGESQQDWSLQQLKERICHLRTAHYVITLINFGPDHQRQVKATYVVKTKIANPEELSVIDENFVRVLAIDNPKMSDVRRFSDACADYPDSAEYASALADYVMGVLLKDQNKDTGVSLPLSSYKKKMQHALDTLRDYERPIANAISAAIKFNLNDFRSPSTSCRAYLLDSANMFFSSVAHGNQFEIEDAYPICNSGAAIELPACPVDRDSFNLLSQFRKLSGKQINANFLADLAASSMSSMLSDYDLSKLRVISAKTAVLLDDRKMAIPILEELANDPIFGVWAESVLNQERFTNG